MHRDHDIGAHPADDIDRKIFEQSPIDIELAVVPYRTEDSRERHGRTQGFRQRSAVEHFRLPGYQIGRNTAKRGGKIVESIHLRVGQGDTIENEADLVPGVEATGETDSILESE